MNNNGATNRAGFAGAHLDWGGDNAQLWTCSVPLILADNLLLQSGGQANMQLTSTISETVGTPRKFTIEYAGNNTTNGVDIAGAAPNTYSGGTDIKVGAFGPASQGVLRLMKDGALGTGDVWLTNSARGGFLQITSGGGTTDRIADTAKVYIGGTNIIKVKLDTGVNETIGELYVSGAKQPAGTWGSSASAATYKNDTYFDSTFTGILTVGGGAVAESATWVGGTTSYETDWSVAGNWTGSGTLPPNAMLAQVTFGNTGSNATPDLLDSATPGKGKDETVGQITFTGQLTTTIQSTGTAPQGKLILDNSAGATALVTVNHDAGTGTHTDIISAPVTLNSPNTSLKVTDSTDTLTLSGAIGGTGGLIVAADSLGTVVLSSANTFTGASAVNSGKLQLNHANALQSSTVSISVANGLAFNTGITTFNLSGLSGASNQALTDTGSNAVTLSVGGTSTTSTYSGALSGAGSLTKVGTGTLTLSSASNSFTGSLWVQNGTAVVASLTDGVGDGNIKLGSTTTAGILQWTGGTLALSNRQIELAGSTGGATIDSSGTGGITITKDLVIGAGAKTLVLKGKNDDTLINTITGKIPNASDGAAVRVNIGTASVNWKSTWVLSGQNTYSGGTYPYFYQLRFGSDSVVDGGGAIVSGPIGTGVLHLGMKWGDNALASDSATPRTIHNAISLDSANRIEFGNTTANGKLTFKGPVTAVVSCGLNALYCDVQFDGVISGSGKNLSFVGNPGRIYTITNLNTYSGYSQIGGGNTEKVSINSIADWAATGAAASALGAPNSLANGTINIVTNATLIYTGGAQNTNRPIKLGGTTDGATIDQSGSGLLRFTDTSAIVAGAGIKTLKLQGSTDGSGQIDGIIQDNSATNKTSLTKDGSGTWTLAGNNTYTGVTNVTNGKLFVNGSQTSATGLVTVSGGATLGGTGTIGGDVTIADTGHLAFNLITDAASHDQLDLAAGKTMAFSGASVLDITGGGTAASGSYTLVYAPGGITGIVPATVNLPAGWTLVSLAKTETDTKLVLTVTVSGAGYASWATANGLSPNPSDDSNNDGVANGVAYFMNKTGLATNPGINSSGQVTWPNGGNILSGQYGTEYVVQTSSDLQTWTDVPSGQLDANTDYAAGPPAVDGSLSYTLTGASPRFVRLKVTPN